MTHESTDASTQEIITRRPFLRQWLSRCLAILMLIAGAYTLIEQSSNRITFTNHTDDAVEILSISVADLREVPALGALPTDLFRHTEFEETGETTSFPACSLGANEVISFSLPHHQIRLVMKYRTRCKSPIYWDQPVAEREAEMFVIRSWGWRIDAMFVPSRGGFNRSNHPELRYPSQPSFLRRMYERSREMIATRSLSGLVVPPNTAAQKNGEPLSGDSQW